MHLNLDICFIYFILLFLRCFIYIHHQMWFGCNFFCVNSFNAYYIKIYINIRVVDAGKGSVIAVNVSTMSTYLVAYYKRIYDVHLRMYINIYYYIFNCSAHTNKLLKLH